MTGNIIKTLRVKDDGGGFPASGSYPLGAEQRFVSAIRNSNNNNLEEQFLMGTDSISTSWQDTVDNKKVIKTKIEYRKDISNPTNFYVLEIVDYEIDVDSRHYTDERPKDGALGAEDIETLIINNNPLSELEGGAAKTIQTSSLYFYKTLNDANPTLVSTKTITKQFKNNKLIIKNVISNRL
jgi:hypothetical protein